MSAYRTKFKQLKENISKVDNISSFDTGRMIEEFVNDLTINEMATLLNEYVNNTDGQLDNTLKTELREMEWKYLDLLSEVESMIFTDLK